MYFVEERRKKSIYKRFDLALFLPIILLSIFGLLVVRSATITRLDGGVKIIIVQSISLLIGVACAIVISFLDYRDMDILVKIAYAVSCVLLVVVLIIGRGDQYGSRSWIKIGGFSFQPAELAKITFVLVVSRALAKLKEKSSPTFRDLLELCAYTAIPILLVIIQKDFGTTCVFLAIFFVLLFIYGLSMKYVLGLIGAFVASMPLAWFFLLNEKRRDRIRVFLNPELDPLGSGMNVLRSKMTIGSGRLFGKGLFSGVQTQNSAVPVKESDFIFSVIGEETGFIVSVLVVLTFLFIILRCVHIAKNSRDDYGKLIVMGFAAMIGVHFVENIGMNIGILPVTGIPLPFISQGGTAMITNFMAIGFILSVSARKKKSKAKKRDMLE